MATETQSQALRPGTKLKSSRLEYTIVKVLGAGSFGITYLAKALIPINNVTITTYFAIKEHFMSTCYRDAEGTKVLCTPTSMHDVEQSRVDFIVEARRLEDLCRKSNSIVSVNETFEANNTAYYVMEYLDGGSPTKMPEDKAIELIVQVARAVSLIHADKVLHLDIKPDNIVMKTGPDGNVYPVLIDFGVAKHFDNTGKPTSQLQVKGASKGYAPQEQYSGVCEFSPRYDVYALGAVLLFLLTGKNPPDAFAIKNNQEEIKAMIPAEVSERTRNAILHAMKPSAFDRTPDTATFISELIGKGNPHAQNPEATAAVPSASKSEPTAQPQQPAQNQQPQQPAQNQQPQQPAASASAPAAAPTAQNAPSQPASNHPAQHVAASAAQPSANHAAQPAKSMAYSQPSAPAAQMPYNPYQPKSKKGKAGLVFGIVGGVVGVVAIVLAILLLGGSGNTIKGHEYVDLGLSVNWATCNVGADRPEKPGTYVAWGELRPKAEYTSATCQSAGRQSGDISGIENRDLARHDWGGSWRMPTKDEAQELITRCTWVPVTVNGTKCFKVVGPNGNFIILPFCGYYFETSKRDEEGWLDLWTSTPADNDNAYEIVDSGEDPQISSTGRYFGQQIRPVSSK